MDQHHALLDAIAADRYDEVQRILATGVDLNAPADEGASPLFAAIVHGNVEIVRLLLDRGADPNFEAGEPARAVYAARPLDLAQQTRFLVDWDKFQPIAALLVERGATDASGASETPEEAAAREAPARTWQAKQRRTASRNAQAPRNGLLGRALGWLDRSSDGRRS